MFERGKGVKGQVLGLVLAALPLDLGRLKGALRDLPWALLEGFASILGIEELLTPVFKHTDIKPTHHHSDLHVALGGKDLAVELPPPPTLFTAGLPPLTKTPAQPRSL